MVEDQTGGDKSLPLFWKRIHYTGGSFNTHRDAERFFSYLNNVSFLNGDIFLPFKEERDIYLWKTNQSCSQKLRCLHIKYIQHSDAWHGMNLWCALNRAGVEGLMLERQSGAVLHVYSFVHTFEKWWPENRYFYTSRVNVLYLNRLFRFHALSGAGLCMAEDTFETTLSDSNYSHDVK